MVIRHIYISIYTHTAVIGYYHRSGSDASRTSGVRPQLTFLFIVSHECRAYEIVKWELNKLILCNMSAFEQEYSQVCL